MITTRLNTNYTATQLISKMKLLFELLKFRLSFLVAFSAGFGYLLGVKGEIQWLNFWALSLGGFLVSGASIIINQVLEKDSDKLMNRTKSRPLPTGKISLNEAITYCFIIGLTGFTLLLVFTNLLTALLGLLSMVLYGFVYTPLKKVGAIAVWVGAVPGALPPMLGWIASTGELSYEALAIFAIQFVWQFPHFWAIAWVMDEDYKKAGIKLLPAQGERNLSSAIQIMLGALLLIPIGFLPMYLGITGILSAVIATLCGVFFLIPTLKLIKSGSSKIALQIMFSSFLYLPIVQIAYLIDKI
jgi:heme o synthase